MIKYIKYLNYKTTYLFKIVQKCVYFCLWFSNKYDINLNTFDIAYVWMLKISIEMYWNKIKI